MSEHGVDKEQAEELRISIGSLKEAVLEEDPLKSNRALSRLLEQEREELSPIGIEEVGCTPVIITENIIMYCSSDNNREHYCKLLLCYRCLIFYLCMEH